MPVLLWRILKDMEEIGLEKKTRDPSSAILLDQTYFSLRQWQRELWNPI